MSVIADVIGLYACIPHVAGLKALKNVLDARENKSILTEKLLKLAGFVLKNIVFEFNGTVKQQISVTASLKFTPESSEESLPSFNIKVKLSKGKMSIDLYVKDTDRHQRLHYTSSHSNHTKRSIVYSQASRIKRICCEEKDFEQHIHEMRSWFKKRAYPNKILD